jgi:predicted nucleic acid-binding protein
MMAILDSGPLISVWNKDEFEPWAVEVFRRHQGPFYTTELVLCEVAHLTSRDAEIAEMVKTGKLLIGASLRDDAEAIARHLERYPHCDLADASVIVASEKRPKLPVISVDRRHFGTYRRTNGTALPVELPAG